MGSKKKDVVQAETATTEAKNETVPTLLWNERGQVGCTLAGHAPAKGTDSWRFEKWKKVPAGTLKDDGSPYQCELCSRGESRPVETASDASVVEEPPKKKAKKAITLADLAERYLAHMDRKGNSAGTIASYGMELKTAIAALGADTPIAGITPIAVAEYFGSDRVTRLKNGKAKSQLSIDKTRRVLRLSLTWAVEAKLLDVVPTAEAAATH